MSTSSDGLERLESVVRGRVQGVGFRYFVLGLAARSSLKGWVANEPDGSVKVVAEGPRPALDSLLVALRQGPPGARVERVEETWLPATAAFDRFGLRSGAHSGD